MRSEREFRVGLVAPKNTPEEQRWLCGFLRGVAAAPYERGARHDLVWFLNVTEELRFLARHTSARTVVIGMEPRALWPLNYEPALLRLADVCVGYKNFAGPDFAGHFQTFRFPVDTRERIERLFPEALAARRDREFCIFARHDPNFRRALAEAAGPDACIAAGPLFGRPVADKRDIQLRCRYELITENEINDYYLSEKLGAALLAGCVPVYYGCRKVAERMPPDLFINMHDFADASGRPDLAAVIRHCRAPGVYERHAAALRERALPVLRGLSIEACLIEPAQTFADALRAAGWRARGGSARFRYWQLRRRLRRALKGPPP